MKVKELMTTDVVSVNQTESLSEAARLMWEYDCGAIPVLDIVSERILGMITDRDICMALWSQDRPASTIRVSGVTSRDLCACKQDDSVASAEKLMRTRQIRRVPVLDQDDRLVGILSLADIVKACQRYSPTGATEELAPTEVTATLGYICSPLPTRIVARQF